MTSMLGEERSPGARPTLPLSMAGHLGFRWGPPVLPMSLPCSCSGLPAYHTSTPTPREKHLGSCSLHPPSCSWNRHRSWCRCSHFYANGGQQHSHAFPECGFFKRTSDLHSNPDSSQFSISSYHKSRKRLFFMGGGQGDKYMKTNLFCSVSFHNFDSISCSFKLH